MARFDFTIIDFVGHFSIIWDGVKLVDLKTLPVVEHGFGGSCKRRGTEKISKRVTPWFIPLLVIPLFFEVLASFR